MWGCAEMKIDLPYLMRDKDRHGNERFYVRKSGQRKVRLREDPGTPEFLAEYHKALGNPTKKSGSERIKPGSLRHLCMEYFASPEFTGLASLTRSRRRQVLDSICQKHGHKRYAHMRQEDVRKLRDAKSHVPESANAIMRALRPMFDWAIEAGKAEENPARDVKYLRTKSDGFEAWTAEECEQFEAYWPTGSRPRLAYAIMRWTGVRRSDAVALGRQHLKEGWLTFTMKKTRNTISVPVAPALQREIDAAEKGMTFLVTGHGKPFTEAGFGNWFAEKCGEAGIEKRAHGLRKTRATELAEGGATVNELMAFFGWETPHEATRYTKAAQQRVLAAGAVRGQDENKSVPPVDLVVYHRDKKASENSD